MPASLVELFISASWGGSALLSKKHRKLLHGIHRMCFQLNIVFSSTHHLYRANSVAWNPHKMLMAGIQCCAFLVKDNSLLMLLHFMLHLKQGLLKRCYSANASYLFQQDKFYDVSYDTGDKSIQCSRRADAFKFWMTWKALGTTGLEERVNRALALARCDLLNYRSFAPTIKYKIRNSYSQQFRYLVDEIKKREGFQLLLEPEYANICFWYIPPSLRNMEEGHEYWEKLHNVSCIFDS
ncbi:hypothetical protein JD844_002857 [Phrynosoma platyrhinos]|uniref:Uncharacterized protein n=1 Tax=Phrynosoma platyrhinos TaxID=52577 RepID=A0ABQ7TCT4_PHRPL|nr:hypothetical protein JD844_002857 [Phrynosoma platyrhinos]